MRAGELAAVGGLALAGACGAPEANEPAATAPPTFQLATTCMVCHDNLSTPDGEDISFGSLWQASIMANSGRDPYWHAAVRREVVDHPSARAEIEDECARCHVPMAHVLAEVRGRKQSVFDLVPANAEPGVQPDPLALDGVSCSVCHQITAHRLGDPESFTGRFVISTEASRPMFGPYDVDPDHASVMQSATGFEPTQSLHVQRSELCATCHTLYTHPRGPTGDVLGTFPEQVPYLEWLHSDYRDEQSCQDCHMPVVAEPTPVTSVLGEPRTGVSRHDFRGANFFMLTILDTFRAELGTVASSLALDRSAARARAFLATSAARVAIEDIAGDDEQLGFTVLVENLGGHKLPTAYPSRRAWLWVTVRDARGRTVFESGRLDARGAIAGNDNDRDPTRFEPHHTEIRSPSQVQIYESIMGDWAGRVTTGLLLGTVYLKDNRVLPRGFDKSTAHPDVAVRGGAADDADFVGGHDRVRYAIAVGAVRGPLTIEAQLWYQPIAFRWAQNLRPYAAHPEPARFLGYWDQLSQVSAIALALARATIDARDTAPIE